MPFFRAAALSGALACLAFAQSSESYLLKDSVIIPSGWKSLGQAPKDLAFNLQIHLTPTRQAEFEDRLERISDPDHEDYGKHMTYEEIEELFTPHQSQRQAVEDWLYEAGFEPTYISSDALSISTDIASVERLLQTEYHTYGHPQGAHALAVASNYSLPKSVYSHISLIHPTTYLHSGSKLAKRSQDANDANLSLMKRWQAHRSKPSRHRGHSKRPWNPHPHKPIPIHGGGHSSSDNTTSCSEISSIPCIMKTYETDCLKPLKPRSPIGVGSFRGDNVTQKDLNLFLTNARPDILGATYTVVPVKGGLNNPNTSMGNSGESQADLELSLALGYPNSVAVYQVGGLPAYENFGPGDAAFLEWTQFLLQQRRPPLIHTCSYFTLEQELPASYAIQACNNMGKLAARGLTMLFSSGDSGVGDPGSCLTYNTSNPVQFAPQFPASCPYGLAVGATQNLDHEVASYAFASGAGFSNFFPMPKYQKAVVNKYIDTYVKNQFEGLYNKTGRAYPDIAAIGVNTPQASYGTFTFDFNGTSASTPITAGILSLANDALLAKGKPPLGFINPLLYKRLYKGFQDITVGSSFGCNTTGFPATKGWDAVTGFGSIRFRKFLSLLQC